MDQLTNTDFRSIGAQIADSIRKESGKVVAWTGRIGAAATGMDWMEFSVVGKPEETLVARMEGEGSITLRPIS